MVWTWPTYLSFCTSALTSSPAWFPIRIPHPHPGSGFRVTHAASLLVPRKHGLLTHSNAVPAAWHALPISAPMSLLQRLPTTTPSETGSCHSLPQPWSGFVPLYWCHVMSSISPGLSWPTLPAPHVPSGETMECGSRQVLRKCLPSESPHKSTDHALYYRC